MEDSVFPSGSNWGSTQLQSLRFPSQPELSPFHDLRWTNPLSQDSLDILQGMERGFGLDENEWKHGMVTGQYEEFYGYLAKMLPRNQEKHLTPRNPSVRSNTHLPSSSTRQSASPWSVTSTVKTLSPSAQKTPSKSVDSKESGTAQISDQSESEDESSAVPATKRRREDSRSPGFLKKALRTDLESSVAPLREAEFRSSQTDSTFLSSEHSASDPEDVSDGDRAETGVVDLLQSMLNRICKAHGDSNGYSFYVENDVETLVIPICGSFPRTKPDLLVRMRRGRKSYSIVDLEIKRLKMNMTKEEKFGQEVAHLLGRANLTKATNISDEYKVFLISAHNTKISISVSEIQNVYLHRLQKRLPGPTTVPYPVHQYGPVDLFDTSQRVLAVSMIYQLMLERAATIIQQVESS